MEKKEPNRHIVTEKDIRKEPKHETEDKVYPEPSEEEEEKVEEQEEDVYAEKGREKAVDDGEISPEEDAFMEGYDEDKPRSKKYP